MYRCRILQPIREEETRKSRRSIDDTDGLDAAPALEAIEEPPKSKKFCLWEEIASEDADASQVQSNVVEVSRLNDCFLFLLSLVVSIFFMPIQYLIYILSFDPSYHHFS